jgi:ferritin-like metal-binding protein YciE
MPTCPGCEQPVSYDRLPIHTRYCDAIWRAQKAESQTTRTQSQRLMDLEEQLNNRLEDHEKETEIRLLQLEKALQIQQSISNY